jgi:hypothetical protein
LKSKAINSGAEFLSSTLRKVAVPSPEIKTASQEF